MSAVWFVLFFPLFGFFLLTLGSKLPLPAVSFIGPGVVGAACIAAIWMFFWDYTHSGASHDSVAYTWIVSGIFKISFGAYIDPLATVMALVVTGVGFLIVLYAVGYINASWTLKVDLICQHFCRLLTLMDERGYAYCVPESPDPDAPTRPLLDFAIEAEACGFESIFISDHFHPWRHTDGHAPFAPAWLAAWLTALGWRARGNERNPPFRDE